MSYGTYRQYDARWGKKNYNGSSNYATAACGPTSCANILHELDPTITPVTTGKFMQTHGYAIRNQGTSWNGIPACLKHFGAKDVKNVAKMADIYSYLSKGYAAVFLFRKGTKGGVTWTTSGHFVAVTGYKHANGKHYFKTFDSGGRKHDGWYCYETQMKGLIREAWVCNVKPVKVAKPKTKYAGTIPSPTLKKGSHGSAVTALQKFLNWYHPWKLSTDGLMGAKTVNALKSFQTTEGLTNDGIYGAKTAKAAMKYKTAPTAKKPAASTKTPTAAKKPVTAPKKPVKKTNAQKLVAEMKNLAWAYGTAKKKYDYDTGAPKAVCKKAMKKYGWADDRAEMSDCGNAASTLVRESGVNKSFKALHGVKTPFPKTEKGFTKVLEGKKIPDGFLKPADFIRYKKENGKQHAMFYFADGKVCEASHHNLFLVIRKDTKRYNTQSKTGTIQVFRPKG